MLICASAHASISSNGSCDDTNTSCTLSGTATGSLKLVFATKFTGAPAITVPAGWTVIDFPRSTTVAACNVSSSAMDTGTGTWTNAAYIAAVSYVGTSAGTTGNCNTTGIGKFQNGYLLSSTIIYYGLSLQVSNGTSLVVGFGSAGTATNVDAVTPTGMTLVAGGGHIAVYNTAPVSSWATFSGGLNMSGLNTTETLEILASKTGGMVPGVY